MNRSPERLGLEDLRRGDVLQHMGRSDLSTLIAWVGDSQYSHSALVTGKDELVEAATGGVASSTLSDRIGMTGGFHYIDVYRPHRPQVDDDDGHDKVIAALQPYMGTPYPMTSLLMLGLVCTVRNKIPSDPRVRVVVRMALDMVIERDTGEVVCSELVYRGFDQADTDPANDLCLPLITPPRGDAPFPDVDIPRLLRECLDDAALARPDMVAASAPLLAGAADTSAADLAERLATARAAVGLNGDKGPLTSHYSPNPRLVLPGDLEFSPGLECIGRLAMVQAGAVDN